MKYLSAFTAIMAYMIQTGNAISLVEHNRKMAKSVNEDPSLLWKATAVTQKEWKTWSAKKFFKTMTTLKQEAEVTEEMMGDRLETDDDSCKDMYNWCCEMTMYCY